MLHSETSIVSKGNTIPEEDRVYDQDKSNFFSHNDKEYWVIDSPDLRVLIEVILNFGMTKPKKDFLDKYTNSPVKDNETQSVTSEKGQSETETEKVEKKGKRKSK